MQYPKTPTKKLVVVAIMTAFSLIMFMVESLFPPVFPFAPGAKLGLSNIFILIALILFDFKLTSIMVLAKCILAMAFYGNPMSFLYSLCGGALSVISMSIMLKFLLGKVSVLGISVVGGLFHNIGQLIVVSLTLGSIKIFYYLPMLAAAGVTAGLVVGIVVHIAVKYIDFSI